MQLMKNKNGDINEFDEGVCRVIENCIGYTKHLFLKKGLGDIFNGDDAVTLVRRKVDAVIRDINQGNVMIRVCENDGSWKLDSNNKYIYRKAKEEDTTLSLLEKKIKGRVKAAIGERSKYSMFTEAAGLPYDPLESIQEEDEFAMLLNKKNTILCEMRKICGKKQNTLVKTLPYFITRTGVSSPSILVDIGYCEWHHTSSTLSKISNWLRLDSDMLASRQANRDKVLKHLKTTFESQYDDDEKASMRKKIDYAKGEIKKVIEDIIVKSMGKEPSEAKFIANAFGTCLKETQAAS